jgi:hypothetical protein
MLQPPTHQDILIHTMSSIVGGIIIILTTSYLVWQHYKYWVDPEAQAKIVPILFYPLVNLFLYCVLGGFLGERSLYPEEVGEIYGCVCLYIFFTLLVYYYRKRAPHHYKINETFEHKDKCTINDTYREKKVDDLFALSTNETYLLPLTKYMLWVNVASHVITLILSILFYEMGLGKMVLPWLDGINTGLVIASSITIAFFLGVVRPVISLYHPTIKFLFLSLPLILLSTQSFILLGELIPLRNTLVCGEMVILSVAYYWVFPPNERTHTADIYV